MYTNKTKVRNILDVMMLSTRKNQYNRLDYCLADQLKFDSAHPNSIVYKKFKFWSVLYSFHFLQNKTGWLP